MPRVPRNREETKAMKRTNAALRYLFSVGILTPSMPVLFSERSGSRPVIASLGGFRLVIQDDAFGWKMIGLTMCLIGWVGGYLTCYFSR